MAILFYLSQIFEEELSRYKLQQMKVEANTKGTENLKTQVSDATSKGIKNESKLWKVLVLIGVLYFLQVVSGGYIVIHYALQMFQATSSSTLDGWISLLILGVIRLVMSIVSVFQFFGRRTLLMVSAFGMTATILNSALWLYLGAPSLAPIILVLLYVAFSSFGVLVVPWTLTAELLPYKYRGSFTGYLFAFNYVLMFAFVKIFIAFLDRIGMANMYLFFGVFSGATFVFVYFAIPETKGKSLDEIQAAL